jgi:hypothetical protein
VPRKPDTDQMCLVYCGDSYDHRKKRCGLRLSDQFLISARSVRTNWSKTIPIFFIHTRDLDSELLSQMDALQITRMRAVAPIEPDFPLANKLLAGEHFCGTADALFLDCDTVIHSNPSFTSPNGLAVAYDCLEAVPPKILTEFFKAVGAVPPSGVPSDRPSYDYYYHDKTNLLPYLNSGVFFLRRDLQKPLYDEWLRTFRIAYNTFRGAPFEFYVEQLSFVAAIHKLGLKWDFFPKGINFICTPRAPHLLRWPKSGIIIEHYAGDTSQPLVFNGDQIDPLQSGISSGDTS